MQPKSAAPNATAFACFAAALLLLLTAAGNPLSDAKPDERAADDAVHGSLRCAYYNHSACAAGYEEACGGETVDCPTSQSQTQAVCMTLAKINGSREMQTCWHANTPECFKKDCVARVEHGSQSPFAFCCCDSDECNRVYRVEFLAKPLPTVPSPTEAEATSQPPISMTVVAVCVCLAGAVVVIIVIAVACYVSRRNQADLLAYQQSRSGQKQGLLPEQVNDDMPLLQLRERIALGRYGCVWKAAICAEKAAPPFYGCEFVAVKVFQLQNRPSFLTERDMYRLPGMRHDNLLSFLGAEQLGDGLDVSLRIVSEYCANGSIYDYLKGHVLSWRTALGIAHGFAQGLAFLHEEGRPGSGGALPKPSIAHRDVKSRNVLLRANLTPCVADLGLALRFEPGRGGFTADVAHSQVGTPRYMAPEVLDGAINFTRDAFLRIDVYACGLVLWELLSRTELPAVAATTDAAADGGGGSAPAVVPDNYEMPFEREVGAHPTLEEMQDAVFVRKLRPAILPTWRRHRDVDSLCDAIEDCWDQDAEARLSASCIQERLRCLLSSCEMRAAANNGGGGGDRQQALMNKLNAERGSCIAAQPPMAFIDEGLPLLPRGDGDCSTASA